MTEYLDQPEDPGSTVTITFACTQDNYDKLFSAAAQLGESRTDALNRACALYWAVMTRERFQTVSWTDVEGRQHTVMKIR